MGGARGLAPCRVVPFGSGAAQVSAGVRLRHHNGGMGLPTPTRGPQPPEYKGAPLDANRGPGLGCFWIQVVALVAVMILAPLSAVLNWGAAIATLLLIAVVVLLLLVGQTSIFLLRLVAADRRGRRAPLHGRSKTVGELEDEARAAAARPPTDGGDMGESG